MPDNLSQGVNLPAGLLAKLGLISEAAKAADRNLRDVEKELRALDREAGKADVSRVGEYNARRSPLVARQNAALAQKRAMDELKTQDIRKKESAHIAKDLQEHSIANEVRNFTGHAQMRGHIDYVRGLMQGNIGPNDFTRMGRGLEGIGTRLTGAGYARAGTAIGEAGVGISAAVAWGGPALALAAGWKTAELVQEHMTAQKNAGQAESQMWSVVEAYQKATLRSGVGSFSGIERVRRDAEKMARGVFLRNSTTEQFKRLAVFDTPESREFAAKMAEKAVNSELFRRRTGRHLSDEELLKTTEAQNLLEARRNQYGYLSRATAGAWDLLSGNARREFEEMEVAQELRERQEKSFDKARKQEIAAWLYIPQNRSRARQTSAQLNAVAEDRFRRWMKAPAY